MATTFHGEGFIISSNNISPVIYPLQNKLLHFPSHSGYRSHLQISLQITTLKGFGKQPTYSNHQKTLFTFHFLKELSQRKQFLLLESEAKRSWKSPILILWKACQSLFQIESFCPKCWCPCNLTKEWMPVSDRYPSLGCLPASPCLERKIHQGSKLLTYCKVNTFLCLLSWKEKKGNWLKKTSIWLNIWVENNGKILPCGLPYSQPKSNYGKINENIRYLILGQVRFDSVSILTCKYYTER